MDKKKMSVLDFHLALWLRQMAREKISDSLRSERRTFAALPLAQSGVTDTALSRARVVLTPA